VRIKSFEPFGSSRASFPQFLALERIMPEIEKLNSEVLKKSVENSGVLFETKLKLAVQDGGPERLRSLLAGDDHKLELLNLKAALQETQVVSLLRDAGIKPSEVGTLVDKLIRNLEFFQISSQVHDAVYTFLPLSWQALKEGELSFRKNSEERNESYSCEINLDLEPTGRLSIAVTLFEGHCFITFNAEDQGFKELIEEEKDMLNRRFSEAGLILKAVNIARRQEIQFGAGEALDLNIKI